MHVGRLDQGRKGRETWKEGSCKETDIEFIELAGRWMKRRALGFFFLGEIVGSLFKVLLIVRASVREDRARGSGE